MCNCNCCWDMGSCCGGCWSCCVCTCGCDEDILESEVCLNNSYFLYCTEGTDTSIPGSGYYYKIKFQHVLLVKCNDDAADGIIKKFMKWYFCIGKAGNWSVTTNKDDIPSNVLYNGNASCVSEPNNSFMWQSSVDSNSDGGTDYIFTAYDFDGCSSNTMGGGCQYPCKDSMGDGG